jgi:phosphohistidine swiveling domain-containing protein
MTASPEPAASPDLHPTLEPHALSTDDRSDFPIVWSDPADADRSWDIDGMHAPFCLAPLAWDYCELLSPGMSYEYRRLAVPFVFHAKVFNGYLYFSFEALVPDGEQEAVFEQYLGAKRARMPLTVDYWERALIELRELYDWIDSVKVDALAAEHLAEAWEGAWDRAQRAWEIHFHAITGPYQVMNDLADLYESVIEGAPPGEAMRLIQGSIDELVDVDAGLGRLTALAAASPTVDAAIRATPRPSIDDLAALPEASDFIVELRRFLEAHGHLGQGFDDLGLASWAEEPSMVISDLATRLERPVEPADERAARLGLEADALADAFRARLADEPERLTAFEELLATARRIGGITETHNYWIDRMAQARLRTLAIRVGERLAREGVIERRHDVLYLRRAEVRELVRSPSDRRAVVAERRAEHERWSAIKPPEVIGKPSDETSSGRFSGVRYSKEAEDIVRGTGASAGVARGPARVVLGPPDFERVMPGDIIIAPSSNPSWIPLFAIAGGLVANTGGVLSHAAVVAREFALPAVVGTGDATTRIADGRIVELDGTTGYVRLL